MVLPNRENSLAKHQDTRAKRLAEISSRMAISKPRILAVKYLNVCRCYEFTVI